MIAALFFRRLTLMIVAAGLPLLAIVFALSALGWLGFRLNMFLNVMTPLIMVISFSDSMQLTFAARDQRMAGRDRRTAFQLLAMMDDVATAKIQPRRKCALTVTRPSSPPPEEDEITATQLRHRHHLKQTR
ncbi:MAG: hypothetical protein JO223_05600 [Hyphomicrobiales bacterium]|nr:hypothetical protein [Hyphomicrobiales bacterium]